MTRVELEPGFVLHTRPFQDTSVILSCLTKEHGVVSLVAKGGKRPRSRFYGYLQPFIDLKLSWLGNRDLKTLTGVEAKHAFPQLTADKILLGLYLNELLIRLLHQFDPHPQLFYDYNEAILALSFSVSMIEKQKILRQFEKRLLAELGYALELTRDLKTNEPISPELLYSYDPAIGIYEISAAQLSKEKVMSVSGASILSLHSDEYHTEMELREAKNLMRYILSHYLGKKTIHSRKLFHTMQGSQCVF